MFHQTYYFFLEDCLLKLEQKYTNLLENAYHRSFLYANLWELPKYYQLFSLKKEPHYHLYQRVKEEKFLEVIHFFVKEIKESNYDPNLIVMLYSYLTHRVFDYVIEPFLVCFAGHPELKMDQKYWNKRYRLINQLEVEMIQERGGTRAIESAQFQELTLSEEELVVLDKLWKKVFYCSYGLQVMHHGLYTFQRTLKKERTSLFRKPFLGFKDFIIRKQGMPLKALYLPKPNHKYDYQNQAFRGWYHPVLNTTVHFCFQDLYQQALEKAMQLLEAANQAIYYQSEKAMKQFNLFQLSLAYPKGPPYQPILKKEKRK